MNQLKGFLWITKVVTFSLFVHSALAAKISSQKVASQEKPINLGYKEVFCGVKICQWQKSETGETLVYKKMPPAIDLRKGTEGFSKKYMANTKVGAKTMGYQVVDSRITKKVNKPQHQVYYLKTQFKKSGESIWLTEKIQFGKRPMIVQHYSSRVSQNANRDLDSIR